MGNIFELDTVFIDFKNESYNLGLDIQANQNDTLTLNFICRNNGIEEDMTKYKVELRVHNNNSNTDYIQTQNENIILGADGSVKIVCQSLKGNKLTAYSGQLNGVLRIFNTENKQKATRIITMRIVADPIQKSTICQSTITKLEELDWILNESYKVETSLKNAIEEAINKKNELIKTTEIASTTNTTLVENIAAGDTLNTNLVTNINEGKTINTTLVTNTNIANEKITTLNLINTTAGKNITDLTEQNTNATKNITDLTEQNTNATKNKLELDTVIINATNKITEVESIVSSAARKITEVETSINNADSSKNELDTSNTTADKNIKNLSEKNDTAEKLNNDLDKHIKYGSKLDEDLKENITTGTKVNEILDNIVPKATKIKDDLSAINDLSVKTKDDLNRLNTEAIKTKDDLASENIKADEKIEAMKNIDPGNVVQDVGSLKKEVGDARGSYSSLDERITNIIGKDVANLYIGDVEPQLDGLWIDTNEVGEVGGSDLLDDVKKYVDNDIKPIIGKIDVEKDGDIASQLKDCTKDIKNLDDIKINKKVKYYTWEDTTKGFNPNNILDGSFLISHELNPVPNGFCYYQQFFYSEVSENANRIQYVSSYNGEVKHFIRRYFNGAWEVKEIATVDDTGWIDLPLAGGLKIDSGLTPRYRKVNNQVYICGSVLGVDTTNKLVGTLPIGFRPFNSHYFVNHGSGGTFNSMTVNNAGEIRIFNNSDGKINTTRYATINTNFII